MNSDYKTIWTDSKALLESNLNAIPNLNQDSDILKCMFNVQT